MTALATATTQPAPPSIAMGTTRSVAEICAEALRAAASVQNDERRARHVAFDALMILYPNYGGTRLGLRLGYAKPGQATAMVSSAKDQLWWRDTDVDHVIGVLVEPLYGERAA
jgi:hypothetical protein